MSNYLHMMIALTGIMACSRGGSGQGSSSQHLISDSAAVVEQARQAYNERRERLGYPSKNAPAVERYLSRADTYFVQFAAPDTSYHGGNIVRVVYRSAIVVDTLPTLTCVGASVHWPDSLTDYRLAFYRAAAAYWQALSTDDRECSSLSVTGLRNEAGVLVITLTETSRFLRIIGGTVRVGADSAEIIQLIRVH